MLYVCLFQEDIYTKFFHQTANVGSSPVTVRSPDLQPGCHGIDQTLPEEIHSANGNILDQSNRRAEPTRCLSPNNSTQILRGCSAGPELASTALLNQSKRTSLCRRFLQEVSLEDGRLHKVLLAVGVQLIPVLVSTALWVEEHHFQLSISVIFNFGEVNSHHSKLTSLWDA